MITARERHAFWGKTGTGKSTRAKEFIGAALAEGWRVCGLDPHDEFSQAGKPSKEVTLGPLRESMTVEEFLSSDHAQTMLDEPELSLALVPRSRPREMAEDFRELVPLVRSTGNLLFFADELGLWATYAEDELNELATQGRHDGMPLVFVAQRAIQVPKTARTQLSHVNTGLQDEPSDLDAIAERTRSRAFADAVGRLDPDAHQFLEWNDREGCGPFDDEPRSKPTKKGK